MRTKTLLLILVIGAVPNIAQAQSLEFQSKALELVISTADHLCNIVSTNGKATSFEAGGKINAELNGLLSKFAAAGGSLNGAYTNSEYSNVLQGDLAATLKDNADCKVKVFKALNDKLLPKSTPGSIEPVNFARQPTYIGLEYNDLDPDQARRLGLSNAKGAVVTGVQDGGAAQLAGIDVNDVILKVDGQDVRDPIDLKRILKKAKPGTKVSLEIWRDRERQAAEMLVSSSP